MCLNSSWKTPNVQNVGKTQPRGAQDARINGIAQENVNLNNGRVTNHSVILSSVTGKRMIKNSKRSKRYRRRSNLNQRH